MGDTSGSLAARSTWTHALKGAFVPAAILLMAAGIVWIVTTNWNRWTSEQTEQKTDDAYLRADLTPLSTKVSGLVASVEVSDYQAVKAGDLLVRLRDEDFRAQVQQAEAGVAAGEAALVDNQRQKDLQEARIAQAAAGISAAQAEIAAATAGVEAAASAIANASSGRDAAKAIAERARLERSRQEALLATESATRQKVEQVVADEERARAQLASAETEIASAGAQKNSREAERTRAVAGLEKAEAELQAQQRQRAVLDAQELQLRADLNAKRAKLALAGADLGYTRIVAPESGIVGERKVLPGQMVNPGTEVISLVQSDPWVQANFKETQVRHMHAGDPVEIRIDAFPGVVLTGKVDQVSPASGSQFALLPPDNATGNFTKIVQRIPVKIVLDAGQPDVRRMRPGLSVIATVRTSGGAGAGR
jgi:membrane fusion protein, multidrug efflux system